MGAEKMSNIIDIIGHGWDGLPLGTRYFTFLSVGITLGMIYIYSIGGGGNRPDGSAV